MFGIVVDQAVYECGRLEKQVFALREQITETEQVVRELGQLSGLDGAIAELKHLREGMEFQCNTMRRMMMALNGCVLDYMSCENRICDNGEQDVARYRRQEIGDNDFSAIADILKYV